MLLFQDDDDEEEEVPLIRKRKLPPTSTSTGGEGGPSIEENKAVKASKKMKKQDSFAQGTPKKDQGEREEKRKKKKNEDPRPKAIVREKSAAKRTKVHKALKISSDSGENPNSQEGTAKANVVEKDQAVKVAGDKIAGPEDDPKPQSETLIKDQNITDEKKQDGMQRDGDAPNAEKKGDALTGPEVEAKEVFLVLFSNFNFFIFFFNLN
jgi:hypothetical protein